MKLSKVDCKYGAPMGRDSYITETGAPLRFHLERCYLDQGGYDNGGAYWGLGTPLYCAWSEGTNSTQRMFVRGETRESAKSNVRKQFPRAKFYR